MVGYLSTVRRGWTRTAMTASRRRALRSRASVIVADAGAVPRRAGVRRRPGPAAFGDRGAIRRRPEAMVPAVYDGSRVASGRPATLLERPQVSGADARRARRQRALVESRTVPRSEPNRAWRYRAPASGSGTSTSVARFTTRAMEGVARLCRGRRVRRSISLGRPAEDLARAAMAPLPENPVGLLQAVPDVSGRHRGWILRGGSATEKTPRARSPRDRLPHRSPQAI